MHAGVRSRSFATRILAAATVLAVGLAASEAGAATGTLRYTTEGGTDHQIVDPAEGHCYEFEDFADSVVNETDRIAELGSGCGGRNNPVAILHPGQKWPRSSDHPAVRSVVFPHGHGAV